MSSLRAIELYAPTEPVAAAATQAYTRPRTAAPTPAWAERVETAIRATGRLGLSPTPCILLGFVLAVAGSLRTP